MRMTRTMEISVVSSAASAKIREEWLRDRQPLLPKEQRGEYHWIMLNPTQGWRMAEWLSYDESWLLTGWEGGVDDDEVFAIGPEIKNPDATFGERE